MAVGMVLLLSMGEIDLSVGAILTLVNIVTAVALREGDADAARRARGFGDRRDVRPGQWSAGCAAANSHDHRHAGHDERLPRPGARVVQGHTDRQFFQGQPAVRSRQRQSARRAHECVGDACGWPGGACAAEPHGVRLAGAGHRQQRAGRALLGHPAAPAIASRP